MSNQDLEITSEYLEDILRKSAEKVFIVWENQEMCVSYLLTNGHTVTGRSAVMIPERFNYDIGYRIARDRAKDMLWAYEAYHRRQKLYESQHQT